jgi:septation ring formation regulator EzrA
MTITEQIDVINKKYKVMQKEVTKLMVHEDATQEDIQTARELLIATAAAIVKAQDKLASYGYSVDRLEGITRKIKIRW